ncbi:MAG TPA: NRDE family protein [Dokdonella sp.]|uniref:NRDE family protein n=1 Tax=Dokdonella sp. TaxID=2291710 RepID=UPI002CFB8E7F|nr:NRDE family protein [Dokdonella sp.]HUD42660.1 NRDE family protein [Dokdonella sp.]
MCLLLIAVDHTPRHRIVLLGNRDEFRARPSTAAAPWPDAPQILGGRDLVAGGSWLAIDGGGRYAAVTNLRNGLPATAPRSRGQLVADYLRGTQSPAAHLAAVRAEMDAYGPFNLIVGDAHGAWLLSSGSTQIHHLGHGIHVVSNGAYGTRWPKTERLGRAFAAHADDPGANGDRWLALLADDTQPGDDELPDTGIGPVLERQLAPILVRGERYGTRASTLVTIDAAGRPALSEQVWSAEGAAAPRHWRHVEEGYWRETDVHLAGEDRPRGG